MWICKCTQGGHKSNDMWLKYNPANDCLIGSHSDVTTRGCAWVIRWPQQYSHYNPHCTISTVKGNPLRPEMTLWCHSRLTIQLHSRWWCWDRRSVPRLCSKDWCKPKWIQPYTKSKEPRKYWQLPTSEGERNIIIEKMESAMMELNATNEAWNQVQASSGPYSTVEAYCGNHMLNVKLTSLPTSDGTRTVDAIIFFLSTLHPLYWPCAQRLSMTDSWEFCWQPVGLSEHGMSFIRNRRFGPTTIFWWMQVQA